MTLCPAVIPCPLPAIRNGLFDPILQPIQTAFTESLPVMYGNVTATGMTVPCGRDHAGFISVPTDVSDGALGRSLGIRVVFADHGRRRRGVVVFSRGRVDKGLCVGSVEDYDAEDLH
jgi:hypothetical protein